MSKSREVALVGGGCSCPSCIFTNRFMGKGFAEWPRGESKSPAKAKAEYSAHVAHSFFGAIKRTTINTDPASFYGTPKGLTRAEVVRVLNATYAANDA